MKKLSLLIPLLLAVCLIFTSCGPGDSAPYGPIDDGGNSISGETPEQPLHKTEIPAGYIGIYTVEELMNADANSSGNYILMNDLDLSSVEDWNGIVNKATFDGNNYTISNLNSTQSGLFKSSNVVENLHLENCKVAVSFSQDRDMYVGGITNEGNTLRNCSATGMVALELGDNCNVTGEYAVGGLIGHQNMSDDSVIASCKNEATVVGATVEVLDYMAYGLRVGGIVGDGLFIYSSENKGNVRLLYNEGTITELFYEDSGAGGICGGVNYNRAIIQNCLNSGTVESDFNAGGILGWCRQENSSDSLNINSCYNSGKITGALEEGLIGKGGIGGICGYVVHYASSSTNIVDCYNVGECSSGEFCGAIIGFHKKENKTNIQYCGYLNKNNITGTGAMFADNKAMTEDEMKNLDNFPFDNKDTVWRNGSGEYPYPVLAETPNY